MYVLFLKMFLFFLILPPKNGGGGLALFSFILTFCRSFAVSLSFAVAETTKEITAEELEKTCSNIAGHVKPWEFGKPRRSAWRREGFGVGVLFFFFFWLVLLYIVFCFWGFVKVLLFCM